MPSPHTAPEGWRIQSVCKVPLDGAASLAITSGQEVHPGENAASRHDIPLSHCMHIRTWLDGGFWIDLPNAVVWRRMADNGGGGAGPRIGGHILQQWDDEIIQNSGVSPHLVCSRKAVSPSYHLLVKDPEP